MERGVASFLARDLAVTISSSSDLTGAGEESEEVKFSPAETANRILAQVMRFL